jgi:hypothetical protein
MRRAIADGRIRGSLESVRMYLDVRVVDGYQWDIRLEKEIERIAGLVSNKRLLYEVLKRGSRLLDRMAIVGKNSTYSIMGSLQTVAAFSTCRLAGKADPNGYIEYVEYILRSCQDEKRVLARLNALPIPRFALCSQKKGAETHSLDQEESFIDM